MLWKNLKNKVTNEDVVYDFDLMKNGGHIKGYLLNNETMDEVDEKLKLLADKEYFKNKRQIDLRISKQIEREVDEEIERVQKILHDKQNPQLF